MSQSCPCCRQPVSVPTLETLTLALNLQPLQAKILRAVWRGKGQPVPTSRVFDVMYEDDYDGGPSQIECYRAFKVALCRLRKRLEGTGVSIECAGYRRGWKLVLAEGPAQAA